MSSIIIYILFVIGLVLIIKGGDMFVDSASKIAEMMKVPKFIIGATIVSVATTLPEMTVSIQATLDKNVDMATGNAIGSVTANTALILGLFITFMPFEIKRKEFSFKGIAMISAIVSLIIGCVITSKKALTFKGEENEYYFLSALGVTLLMIVFTFFFFENIKCMKEKSNENERSKKSEASEKIKCFFIFIIGAISIVVGAKMLVTYGTEIALCLNISQRVISVIAVAIGTSLPELATAITALKKKSGSLSAGNILGANIIDLTLILPICSIISIINGTGELAISVSSVMFDIMVCLGVIIITVVPTIISQKFHRWQGILLLLSYGIYVYFVVK